MGPHNMWFCVWLLSPSIMFWGSTTQYWSTYHASFIFMTEQHWNESWVYLISCPLMDIWAVSPFGYCEWCNLKFMCTFSVLLGIPRSEVAGSYHICMFHGMAKLFREEWLLTFYVPSSSVQGSQFLHLCQHLSFSFFFIFSLVFPSWLIC